MEQQQQPGDLGHVELGMGAVFQALPPSTGWLFYHRRENPDVLGLKMTKKIRVLFEKLKKTPFPDLGKSVGDFALYDSLMAGTVSSFLGGEKIDLKTIPIPDKETQTVFKALEKKRRLDGKETDFVRYVQLWEELAEEIKNAVKVGRGKGNGTAKQESAVLGPANQ